jgi:hypothetical protein
MAAVVAVAQILVQRVVVQIEGHQVVHTKKWAEAETPSLLALYRLDLQKRNPLKKW